MKLLFASVLGVAAIASLSTLLQSKEEVVIGGYTTSLAGRTRAQRHNSELSLAKLNNLTIAPGATFSFNRCVGTFTSDAGYRRAPVSYNGQLIESWGGGVCQTSTTLYNAALLAGLEIVERSRHRFSPSYVAPGRDAAVAFDTIDLKLRNPYSFPVTIKGDIESNRLTLKVYGPHALAIRPSVRQVVASVQPPTVYEIGRPSNVAHVRNTGKMGYQVNVYRTTGSRRELISSDSYPSMARVVSYK